MIILVTDDNVLVHNKGQLISERNFGTFKYPKKGTEFLKDFRPNSKMGKIKKIKALHSSNTSN